MEWAGLLPSTVAVQVDGCSARHIPAQQPADESLRSLHDELATALLRNKLEVHYQPVVDLETLRPVGAEALIRWPRTDVGWVPPTLLIEIAEYGGIIHDVGQWGLRRACADAAQWVDLVPHGCNLAVNLSGCQLAAPTLVSLVRTALRRTGLAPERLMLEITETAYPKDIPAAAAALHALHDEGVGLA